jgi:hypothetical protein
MLTRAAVFLLACLSFACLLGSMYGLWTMRCFGSWVLPPATLALAAWAFLTRDRPRGAHSPFTWIVEGALGGVLAAAAYDLYRLPFVLGGAPLFKVFPRFGELLLESDQPRWLVHLVGWAYHFSNGAALGIMFLALVASDRSRTLFWGAVTWALFVEAALLLSRYTDFFGLEFDATFVALTLTAHMVFGLALGLWCQQRLARPAASSL